MAEETRDFLLPDLGEGLTDAEIVQWLVKAGDTVDLNQPIVEVETEKAIVEIPSPFAGTVESVFGDVGQRVNVGSTLITIRTAASAPTTGRKEVLVGYGPEEGAGKRRKQRKIGRRETAEPEAAAEEPQQQRSLATPPVRKLARDMGVDIDAVHGSGPDGRVTRDDVLATSKATPAPVPVAAAAAPVARRARAAEGPDEERIPVRSIRRSIAERMVRSKFTIPHVAEWLQVDATELMRLRADLQGAPEAEEIKISPLPIIVKALIAAIRKFPIINSSWNEDAQEIIVKHRYHVGIATDTDRGLIVPVVRDADQLNVFELAKEISRLAQSARAGSIGVPELTGSTITVTNVGSFGMESGTPIINFPEAAILAPGTIQKRPWVVGDEIVARDIMTLALSFDHRVIDGATAGRFLRYLADLIEKPARLFGVL